MMLPGKQTDNKENRLWSNFGLQHNGFYYLCFEECDKLSFGGAFSDKQMLFITNTELVISALFKCNRWIISDIFEGYYLGQINGSYLGQVCAQKHALLSPDNNLLTVNNQQDLSYKNVLKTQVYCVFRDTHMLCI